MSSTSSSLAAIIETAATYPAEPPFHPDTHYPEFPDERQPLSEENGVFAAVRDLLAALKLDEGRLGTSSWNPLSDIVRAGDTVAIKPNLIRESRLSDEDQWHQVITHGSVVRAIVDYVALALQGTGKILIVDGPQTDSSFDTIVRRSGLELVRDHVRGLGSECELLDLRREHWVSKGGVLVEREALPGDPRGYVEVPLDEASEFADRDVGASFYGADYDVSETASYHSGGRHRYVMCRTVMAADVVIDLAKLKTHKKTGVTLCLKNMVGVNGLRNCLPHFSFGAADHGGDEFPPGNRGSRLQSRAIRLYKRVLAGRGGTGGTLARLAKRGGELVYGGTDIRVRSGNWFGNDTAWRMVLDVNKALVGFDAEGRRRTAPLRMLCLVDGIVGGEGDGPSDPDARHCGVLVGGLNPVVVDTVSAILMGFDDRRIPVVARAWSTRGVALVDCRPDEVECISNRPEWRGSLADLRKSRNFGFRAHFGWQGQVEGTGS